MTRDVSGPKYEALRAAPPANRVEYTVKEIADSEIAFVLADADGFVTASKENKTYVPLWPHPQFAQDKAIDDWANCHPEAIDLQEIANLLDNLEADGWAVWVFPVPGVGGAVLEPSALRALLVEERAKMGLSLTGDDAEVDYADMPYRLEADLSEQ